MSSRPELPTGLATRSGEVGAVDIAVVDMGTLRLGEVKTLFKVVLRVKGLEAMTCSSSSCYLTLSLKLGIIRAFALQDDLMSDLLKMPSQC